MGSEDFKIISDFMVKQVLVNRDHLKRIEKLEEAVQTLSVRLISHIAGKEMEEIKVEPIPSGGTEDAEDKISCENCDHYLGLPKTECELDECDMGSRFKPKKGINYKDLKNHSTYLIDNEIIKTSPPHDDMRKRIEQGVNEIIMNELGKKVFDPQDINTKWDWNATCRFEKQCNQKQRREFLKYINGIINRLKEIIESDDKIIKQINFLIEDLEKYSEEKEK